MRVAKEVCPQFTIISENRKKVNDLFYWCIGSRDGRLDPDKGLWLWGNIGTGKTTMLEIIKRFCRRIGRKDKKGSLYGFRTSNVIAVCSDYANEGIEGIKTYIESDRQAFDELGAESVQSGYYGNQLNVMQYILQARYDKRHASFTHVTTNINMNQIAEIYGARIYDRALEMFNFVELSGYSQRKKSPII